MDKEKLVVGKSYLRRRKTTYAGREVQAESWIRCIQVIPEGAVFWGGDNILKLTNEQVKKEVLENDCGLCDLRGVLVEEDDACEKWNNGKPDWRECRQDIN